MSSWNYTKPSSDFTMTTWETRTGTKNSAWCVLTFRLTHQHTLFFRRLLWSQAADSSHTVVSSETAPSPLPRLKCTTVRPWGWYGALNFCLFFFSSKLQSFIAYKGHCKSHVAHLMPGGLHADQVNLFIEALGKFMHWSRDHSSRVWMATRPWRFADCSCVFTFIALKLESTARLFLSFSQEDL